MFMKKYLGIFFLALVTLIVSCKKDEINEDEVLSCSECGQKVGEIKDRQGSVVFDSTVVRYYIMMPVPGTIDSYDIGYVCDLHEEHQKVGKRVVVSGSLFLTSLAPSRSFCCLDKAYCLKLSSVEGI